MGLAEKQLKVGREVGSGHGGVEYCNFYTCCNLYFVIYYILLYILCISQEIHWLVP